jgi:hypothetical protein
LCARHHFEFDRSTELQDQVRQYRRGYQLTSTDALIAHLVFTGITINEARDGYHWSIDGTDLHGHRTSAIYAVGAAIYQLRNLLTQTQADLVLAQDTIRHLEKELATERKMNQALLRHLALVSGNHRFRRIADTL